MTTPGQLVIQPTKDPDMVVFNVRHQLTENEAEDGTKGNDVKLGEFGRLILAIRGVEQVRVQAYRFFVSKGASFSWDEIQPSIEEVINHLVRSQAMLGII